MTVHTFETASEAADGGVTHVVHIADKSMRTFRMGELKVFKAISATFLVVR